MKAMHRSTKMMKMDRDERRNYVMRITLDRRWTLRMSDTEILARTISSAKSAHCKGLGKVEKAQRDKEVLFDSGRAYDMDEVLDREWTFEVSFLEPEAEE